LESIISDTLTHKLIVKLTRVIIESVTENIVLHDHLLFVL